MLPGQDDGRHSWSPCSMASQEYQTHSIVPLGRGDSVPAIMDLSLASSRFARSAADGLKVDAMRDSGPKRLDFDSRSDSCGRNLLLMPVPESETWRVCIRDAAGVPYGAGVFLGNQQVLTCAHVVSEALKLPTAGPAPLGEVRVDFPGCRTQGLSLRAYVDPRGWFPVNLDGTADLAVLTIVGEVPPGAVPPTLRPWARKRDVDVRAYGHPLHSDGTWAPASVLGTGGPGAEWVQLQGTDTVQYPITRGFSGAGVVLKDTDVVIGCIITVLERQPGVIVAWMLPLETVISYLPGLAKRLDREAHAGAGPQIEPVTPESRTRRRQTAASASRDQATLFEALLDLEPIRLRSKRDELIRELIDLIGRQFFSVPRFEALVEDVTSLITACLSQPGAMHALLDLLERYRIPNLVEVDALVRGLVSAPLLTSEERRDLYAVMSDIESTVAADCYLDAVGTFGRALPSTANDTISIIRVLEGLNKSPDGLPPLAIFAEYIAHNTTPEKATVIRDWVDRHLTRTGIVARYILPFRMKYSKPRTSGSDIRYVVIRLRQDELELNLYQLEVWLQRSRQPWEILVGDDDKLYELTHVRNRMDDLLNIARRRMPHDAVPTVEFILPRHLLSLAVDGWQVGGILPRRLGESYPVVVRSLERMEDVNIHPQWRLKWNWVTTNGHTADPSGIAWLWERDAMSAEELRSHLTEERERPACLALGYPPVAGGLGRDEVSIGLSAGLPIMVWCRQEYERAVLEAELTELLSSRGLLELPELVKSRRSVGVTSSSAHVGTSQQTEEPIGHQLGLLYDDAARIPEPPLPVHAPGQRRLI